MLQPSQRQNIQVKFVPTEQVETADCISLCECYNCDCMALQNSIKHRDLQNQQDSLCDVLHRIRKSFFSFFFILH